MDKDKNIEKDKTPIWKKKSLILATAVTLIAAAPTLAGCSSDENSNDDKKQEQTTSGAIYSSHSSPFIFRSGSQTTITSSDSAGWHAWTVEPSGGYSGVHAVGISG